MRGVLCFTRAELPLLRTLTIRSHLLLYRKALGKRIDKDGPLSPNVIEQVARKLGANGTSHLNNRPRAARRQNRQTHMHHWCVVYAVYANCIHGQAKSSTDPCRGAGSTSAGKRDRMARVQVDDDVWRECRALASCRPISEVLGQLVEREVRRARSSRLRDGRLDDREVVDALDRARAQQAEFAAIVARLESLRAP